MIAQINVTFLSCEDLEIRYKLPKTKDKPSQRKEDMPSNTCLSTEGIETG